MIDDLHHFFFRFQTDVRFISARIRQNTSRKTESVAGLAVVVDLFEMGAHKQFEMII